MDVEECIIAYTKLIQVIFGKSGLPVDWKGKTKGRFDSKVLENAIKQMITDQGLRTSDLLNDGKDRGCRVLAYCVPYLWYFSKRTRGSYAQRRTRPERSFVSRVIRPPMNSTIMGLRSVRLPSQHLQ